MLDKTSEPGLYLKAKISCFSKTCTAFGLAKVWLSMELVKVSTCGQITLPLSIRKRLEVNDGDKVVFLEENGRVIVENAFSIEREVSPEFLSRKVSVSPCRSRVAAVKEIRQIRARCKPVTVDEIIAWRNEGRP
jgi:AbrB family looped-hinge helix DNA binding protein